MESNVFDEVTDTDNPQGILALCKMPDEASVNDLKENEGVIVATDAIQDPGNLGTIIRTSAWFGSKALLSGKGSVDVYNPKVVRSTAGATGALPVISGDLNEILSELESSGWKTLLLDGNPGATALNELPVHNKTILVVGNEANGIDKSLITPDRTRVLIPCPSSGNPVESLNAAVAMSIALWSVNN
jgi:TrmH family RNA methyltransferase